MLANLCLWTTCLTVCDRRDFRITSPSAAGKTQMLDEDAREETEMKAIEVYLPPGQVAFTMHENGENPPKRSVRWARQKNRRRQIEIPVRMEQIEVRDAPRNRQSPDGGVEQ